MRRKHAYHLLCQLASIMLLWVGGVSAQTTTDTLASAPSDTIPIVPDSTLPYPFSKGQSNAIHLNKIQNPLNRPQLEYNAEDNIFEPTVVDINNADKLHWEAYMSEETRKFMQTYLKEKTDLAYSNDQVSPLDTNRNKKRPSVIAKYTQLNVDSELYKTVFGSEKISFEPKGFFSADIGVLFQDVQDPSLPEDSRGSFSVLYEPNFKLNLDVALGEKLKFDFNYDQQSVFSFDNVIKNTYEGEEDDILKSLEIFNFGMDFSNSLIAGSQNLQGGKAKFQFENTFVTIGIGQQNSQNRQVQSEGGAVTKKFEIPAVKYDKNKHYFLSTYFYDQYDRALANIPFINSNVVVTRVEVWVTNIRRETQNVRNIVALYDLGEAQPHSRLVTSSATLPFPNNTNNSLDPDAFTTANSELRDFTATVPKMISLGFEESADFIQLENARRLTENEYVLNPRLGYISLSNPLNGDQVLAVAYEYTYNGQVYKVGEFSNDGIEGNENIMTKMLKSNDIDVTHPIWNLMMKNVYALNTFNLKSEDFRLDVTYANDKSGVLLNYLPDGKLKEEILLRVFNLDKVNLNQAAQPDGYFDFLDNATVSTKHGLIFFPSVEPFGRFLEQKLEGDAAAIKKYVFKELYTTTQTEVLQRSQLDKFFLTGHFKSSSSNEIPLGAINVPKGSVRVTSAGRVLQENIDYVVNYQIGKVTIINQSLIESRAPINVALESNSVLSSQDRLFVGLDVEHRFTDNFILTGSLVNLSETPFTGKVNTGDEPVSNLMLGTGLKFNTEAQWLTRSLDYLPIIETKEMSTIDFQGEFAQLFPGSPDEVQNAQGQGESFIDDFEGARNNINIINQTQWTLASTPAGDGQTLFPEGGLENDLRYGYNRAKISWYNIDPLFFSSGSNTPSHIIDDLDQKSDHRVRQVGFNEIFPQQDRVAGQPNILNTLNISYFPKLRGPYNYDLEGTAGISQGVEADGNLRAPESRWGGIMRSFSATNFELANVEFIEFWMMDPFLSDADNTGGKVYFHLGNVSEDILRDGVKAFEQGLSTTGNAGDARESAWGRAPVRQSLVRAFDNNAANRAQQDVGLDGLNDENERLFFADFINRASSVLSASALQNVQNDPSSDNFEYYRGTPQDNASLSILGRYRDFNGLERNSRTLEQSPEDFSTASTGLPDIEDVNNDNTLSRKESYYQYSIELSPTSLNVGENYIVDRRITNVRLDNGEQQEVTWYQFRIPIFDPEKTIGNINNFRSIRFMRMIMREFESETTLRFAQMQLVRQNWRRYANSLKPDENDGNTPVAKGEASLEVSSVNLEENASRTPIPYVLPPGVVREEILNNNSLQSQNEQSLVLRVDDLDPDDARAAFKTLDLDMRNYSRIKMFIHAESRDAAIPVEDNRLEFFIRMGSDVSQNYYEYRIPLRVTPFGSSNPSEVWYPENNLDISTEILTNLKLERNRKLNRNEVASFEEVYSEKDGNNTAAIKGNPNFSNIRNIMVGVRYPKENGTGARSVEVWANELRLSDFNEKGGWAANASMNAKLADLGTVSVNGQRKTIGFGSVEQNVSERTIEDNFSYNINTTIDMGKLLPKEWNMQIPVSYSYGEEKIDPRFDPLVPDVEFETSLDALETQEEKDSVERVVQDYTERSSISLTDVRQKAIGSTSFYSFSNFSFSFANSKTFKRNINTSSFEDQLTTGGIKYQYNFGNMSVKPLSFLEDIPVLNFLSDLELGYFINSYSIQGDFKRSFIAETLRNIENPEFRIETFYQKTLDLNTTQTIRYKPISGVDLSYTSKRRSVVDEPEGELDNSAKIDSLLDNLKSFGRPLEHGHDFTMNFKLPLIDKIKYLRWMQFSYNAKNKYGWVAAPQALEDEGLDIGNTIEQNLVERYNIRLNLQKLYQTIPFIRNSMAQKRGEGLSWLGYIASVLTSVKNVTLSRNISQQNTYPGFTQDPGFWGSTLDNGQIAPSLDFAFGPLGREIDRIFFGNTMTAKETILANQWLSTDTAFNTPFTETLSHGITYQANIQPLPFITINLRGSNKYSEMQTETYRFEENIEQYQQQGQAVQGSFNSTFWTFSTFTFTGTNGNMDDLFETFIENRLTIADRLALEKNGGGVIARDADNFPKGYSGIHQDVLLNSFLATYSGQSASDFDISTPFRSIPLPNWRVTLSPLRFTPALQEIFTQMNFSHGYTSMYSISNFNTNLLYEEGKDITNARGDFVTPLAINDVKVVEAFSPLLKVDMTTTNNISFSVGVTKNRSIGLNIGNGIINELTSDEIEIGLGYIIKDFEVRIPYGNGRVWVSKDDLVMTANFSFKENLTLARKVSDSTKEITNGQTILNFKSNIQYDNLFYGTTFRLFFELSYTEYATSNIFPVLLMRGGFGLKIDLEKF